MFKSFRFVTVEYALFMYFSIATSKYNCIDYVKRKGRSKVVELIDSFPSSI